MMRFIAHALTAGLMVTVAGCSTVDNYWSRWFGSKPAVKPAALVEIKPTVNVKLAWQGAVGGAGRYVFTPAVTANAVYAASAAGQIVAFERTSGKVLTRIDAKTRLSGGVGSDGRLVAVGTPNGEVLAFESGGKPLWKTQLSSEILSAPQIDSGLVVVRSGDGRIYGLDAESGARRWVYQRSMPALTIRSHTGVLLYRGAVFAGFPGGRLVALTLVNGNVGWEATVAFPKGATELERVADVASLPVADNRQVCAVAFQGRLACIDISKGTPLWARDISSVAGIAMDARSLYVSDDTSAVVAFDKQNGSSVWRQDRLSGRNISGPAILGNYVAVGDYQGYIHFLRRDDGSFAARIATDGSPIIAQPIAIDGDIVVQTRDGGVFTIRLE